MAKTIKQLADELGVSKTAIRKKLTPEFREKYIEVGENGVLLVSEDGEKLLESMRKPQETNANLEPETTENQLPPKTIEWYQEQLEKAWQKNAELQDKLMELSDKVGDSLKSITGTQFADKLIEGQKLQQGFPEVPDDDIKNQSVFKKLKWVFSKEK